MLNVLIGPHLLRKQPGAFREVLSEAGFQTFDPEGCGALTGEQLRALLPLADAMIAGGERMTPEMFAIAPRLRVIARAGVGYDLVDIEAATAHKVAVTITPGTNQESVAEQTFAFLLALCRELVIHDREVHGGGWDHRLIGQVRGKALGLVGLGRIGQAVAARAHAFRMRIIAHDPIVDQDFDDRYQIARVDMSELLATADVISLHVPLNEQTRGMVNRDFLAKMRRGAFLINTSRGGLVVEGDLRDSLASGHLGGAGLDVLNHEPPEPGNPLLGLPNVILSPHVAGTDHQSMSDMAELAARTIVELYHNRWPAACVVNRQLQDGWRW
jgi:phosphoglycerate dehydrogenase-like enzyme